MRDLFALARPVEFERESVDLREVVDGALLQLAYRLSDRQAPPAPRLGSPPHLGLCSGCHYTQAPLDIRDMPHGFHERLLEARRDR